MRIDCTPKRIFSWNYRVRGEGHNALLEFRWADETGSITLDGKRFTIAEDGGLGGRWELRDGETTLAVARGVDKAPPTFTIQKSPMGTIRIRATGRTERVFDVKRGGKLLARIAPVHWLTRRARIETLVPDCDFLTMLFLFWIVVVSWRRSVVTDRA